ncbi:hypothetical protein EO763_23165 (plasmid) [Pectobacterium odoriferum]|uniref:hypothetical protein n=1 Tax=Pectobacterium odoriferum TaxID=78398 RepID=UPI00137446BE|nr:hypothetical protein [Pectobacterium odoriferum]QHP82796.1 hypothetical protein EO763_23165 [Pectobacterium odoriferum]
MVVNKSNKLRELQKIGTILSWIESGRTRPLERMPFIIFISILSVSFITSINFRIGISNNILIILFLCLSLATLGYYITYRFIKDRETWVSQLFFILCKYEPNDRLGFITLQNAIRDSLERNANINYEEIREWQRHEVELIIKEPIERNVDNFISKQL